MLSNKNCHGLLSFWQRLHRKPLNLIGLYGSGILVILAIYPNWLIGDSTSLSPTAAILLPPAWLALGDISHLLGTDQHGYDIFILLVKGVRSSFGLSLILTIFITGLSLFCSLWFSFKPGILSRLLIFLLRCISLLPSLLIGIILALILGATLLHAALAVSIAVFPAGLFRISQKLQLEKSKEYITNAYLEGATHYYVIIHLLLPNSMQDIIEEFVSIFTIILLEITMLAFFNLSGPPQLSEWGSLMREGSQLIQHSLLYILYPGLALIFSLCCIQLLARGIIDAVKVEDN